MADSAKSDEMQEHQHHGKHGTVLFFNEDVTVTDQEVAINWYYFPVASAKHIPYSDILRAELLKMADMDFLSTKTWGMGLSNIWWHCDFKRLSRVNVIMLTLKSQSIQVAITTDDADVGKIFDLITKHKHHAAVASSS